MNVEIKQGKKMKIVGYLCLGFAAVISIVGLFTSKITIIESLPVIYYWGGLGVTMLFGNAAKKIIGNTQAHKQNGSS